MGPKVSSSDRHLPSDGRFARFRLVRRISLYAANLLLTGLVIFLGWGAAKKYVWSKHPSKPVESTLRLDPAPWTVESQLEFGDQPFSFRRRTVNGDSQRVRKELRDICHRAALSNPLPISKDPQANETRLLGRLANAKPRLQTDAWRLFELDDPLPMACVVRTPNPGERERLICWGLAFPSQLQADSVQRQPTWTLFVATHSESSNKSEVEIPIPPGGTKLLSIRSQDGTRLLAFRGEGTIGQWREFYDQSFDSALDGRTTRWEQRGQSCWLRVRLNEARNVEIQLTTVETETGKSQAGTRKLRGLIMVTR